MSNVRKTSNDYLKEYNKLKNELESLKNEVSERFLNLCIANPDIIIYKYFDTDIKAKSYNSKTSINFLSFDNKIRYLRTMEEQLALKNKHVQGKLFK